MGFYVVKVCPCYASAIKVVVIGLPMVVVVVVLVAMKESYCVYYTTSLPSK